MLGRRNKRSLGRTAATGLLVDPDIRRAAVAAAPPVARLGFTIGRRLARLEAQDRLGQAAETFDTLRALLSTAGPQLAEQLGLIEPPRRSRVGPVLAVTTVVAVSAVVLSDAERRQKVQRLIVH